MVRGIPCFVTGKEILARPGQGMGEGKELLAAYHKKTAPEGDVASSHPLQMLP
jgi:hypothetical protein